MRLVNGQKIKFNLQPNLYPQKKESSFELLAKRSIITSSNNNYTFDQDAPKNELELYDLLVKNIFNEFYLINIKGF